MPYTDAPSLNAWEVEYGFSDSGRWGWMRQLYGHIFSAQRGTYASLIAFGSTRNGAQTSIMGFETASPSPCYEWAAAYCSKAQRALINDPARPLQTLTLEGILLAQPSDRFIMSRDQSARRLRHRDADGERRQRPADDLAGNHVLSVEPRTASRTTLTNW